MRGSSLMRAAVVGLVLTNLVFVQLTGSARLLWLAPLYALTLLAPLLRPWREKLLYRALWNTGVLGVFGVLVWHASGYDLRYVLEDGLVLAALCQVHLLNNLRSEQGSDLLFLNSFLIAIATGFFSQDLAYAAAFLVYAPLFVLGLQLRSAMGDGEDLAPAHGRRVLRDGAARAAVLLAATLAVFLFWPRDFQRPGFLVSRFDFAASSDSMEIAFEDSLKLEREGRARASDRVVMRVELLRGSPGDVPTLWRGATLGATNGDAWWPFADGDLMAADTGDEFWRFEGETLVRGGDGETALLAVENVDPRADRLFAPLSARRVALGLGAEVREVLAEPDGTLRYGEPRFERPPVEYELALGGTERPVPGGRTPDSQPDGVRRYTALPPTDRLKTARELAERLAARLPPGFEQHALVGSFSDHLASRHPYLAPGADGAAGTLTEFLAEGGGGHCEFFASALVSMLRSRGVPARIATGYRSEEWDQADRTLTFRARNAHAWAEVYDPTAGWYPVDPTPAAPLARERGFWPRLYTAVGATWEKLVGFDSDGRAAALAWLKHAPGRSLAWVREQPTTASLVLGLLALSAELVRRRRRRATIPAVLDYRRTVRRAGLRLEAGETPRELLGRARELSPERARALQEATREHERARYAG